MNTANEDTPVQASMHGLMEKTSRIFYFVPFERDELKDASVFRLYSRGLMRTAPLHVAATQLPADICEICCDWPTIAAFRASGAVEHMIFPLFLDALPDAMKLLQNRPFRCVLSDPVTAPAVEELLADQPRDWLHFSLQGDSKKGIEPLPSDWPDFVNRLQNRLEGATTPAARLGLSNIQAATSVANTMLMLGARTVLGTYLPVLASYSSAFIARLLLRIAQYIPIAAARGFEMRTTWRSVVTGMQRMTYVTEVLFALATNEKVNVLQHYREICNKANHDINFGDPMWHENVLNLLARLTGRSVEDLLKDISKWASLVDVMHYVQLGNPETLHIVTDKFYEDMFPSAVNAVAEQEAQLTVDGAAIDG